MGERFEPWQMFGSSRVEAWERVNCPPWLHDRVYVGQLADGRWFAEATAEGCGWAYPTEDEARAAAQRMRAVGEWEPCEPNP